MRRPRLWLCIVKLNARCHKRYMPGVSSGAKPQAAARPVATIVRASEAGVEVTAAAERSVVDVVNTHNEPCCNTPLAVRSEDVCTKGVGRLKVSWVRVSRVGAGCLGASQYVVDGSLGLFVVKPLSF